MALIVIYVSLNLMLMISGVQLDTIDDLFSCHNWWGEWHYAKNANNWLHQLYLEQVKVEQKINQIWDSYFGIIAAVPHKGKYVWRTLGQL